jgi:hypothetical protein
MAGKERNPVTVWLLVLVTFGIYGIYWWYKANEEVGQYDSSIEVNPVLATLALFVPICNIVTIVRTGSRIGQAQENTMGRRECSGGLGFLLAILFALDFMYYQANLNKLWEQSAVPGPGEAPAPAAPAA